MAVKSLKQTYLAMRSQPMWSLLASDNAPETLSLLQVLLFNEDRALPASLFINRLEILLNELTSETVNHAQTLAKANQWRNAGYINLRYMEGQDEPVYELTSSAHEAIRFISGQRSSRTSPTESRLELLIHAIRKIAQDTDENIETRIERLEADKGRINQQIEQLKAGHLVMADDQEILAQVQDILEMVEGLNGDFYRVRDRFRELSQAFHEDIMENEGTAGSILDEFFSGYDRIAESDEGKSFRAFYAFMNNPEAIEQIEDSIESLQDREFWSLLLSDKEQKDLLYLRRNLNLRARETQMIMKLLASSLKHVVQSRDYLRNRRIVDLIGQARHDALLLREIVSPNRQLYTLPQSSAQIISLSNLELFDPQTDATLVPMIRPEVQVVDLDALSERVMAAEINYPWLKECVEAVLATQSRASVADVLERFPANQGLASIVGLISLAVRHGVLVQNEQERVSWEDRLGQTVSAHIPMLIFNEETLKKWRLRGL